MKYSQDVCPCGYLPPVMMTTNYKDEAIVFDVITPVAARCRLCGRKFTLELIPGDFSLEGNEDLASCGYEGEPLLSMGAEPRGAETLGVAALG